MTDATLALDAEVTKRGTSSLAGAIMNWRGRTLAKSPRVRVFDTTKGITDLLQAAMNLKKGAWRFYAAVAQAEKALMRVRTRAVETFPELKY
jgi:hypothetical protein